MYTHFLSILFTVTLAENPCPLDLTTDLTESHKLNNGDYKKYDEVFTPAHRFWHNGTLYGCVCNLKTCIRKCCKEDELITNSTCIKGRDSRFTLFNIKDNISSTFHNIYGYKCSYSLIPYDEYLILSDGSLETIELVPRIYPPLSFCIDDFNDYQAQIALMCTQGEIPNTTITYGEFFFYL